MIGVGVADVDLVDSVDPAISKEWVETVAIEVGDGTGTGVDQDDFSAGEFNHGTLARADRQQGHS